MLKRAFRWLDLILLLGLFFPMIVGIGMVLSGNDTVSSFTIGLLSTIVALLIDVAARIQKAETSFINAAGFSRILGDEVVGKTLQQIANLYEAIKEYDFDHYSKIADMTVDECATKLREVASGSVTVTAKSIQGYGTLGFQQARRDIKVIHAGPMAFWVSDFGRKYMELNRAAAKRGVQITRIFALTPEEARDSIELLREQERTGIRVLVVRPDRVKYEFMIFDQQILVDFDIEDQQDYRLERIVLDPAQVKRRLEEFQQVVVRFGRTVNDIIATT